MACDVIESKLEAAKKVGADVVINCQQQNLKDTGETAVTTYNSHACIYYTRIVPNVQLCKRPMEMELDDW